MKNILIVAYHFPPENNGGTERIKQFYQRLRNKEYETYVLTADKPTETAPEEDTHVLRTKALWYCLRAYEGFMRKYKVRIPVFLWIAKIFLKWNIRRIKPDICIASFPPALDFYIGILLNQMGVQLIADFRDGLMYDPFYIINSNKKYEQEMIRLEKRIAEKSDLIVTASPQITEYIQETYHGKAFTIPNGFDDTEIIKEVPLTLTEHAVNVLYTGGLDCSRKGIFQYVKSCLEYMFQDHPNMMFHFVGDYTEEEKAFFSHYNNVKIYKKTSREKAVATQRAADLLLLVTGDSANGTSGKLYEYLFSEKPVLHVGGRNNACKIIEETNAGVTFGVTQRQQINRFLESISSAERNPYVRQNLVQYTRKQECECFMKLIKQI